MKRKTKVLATLLSLALVAGLGFISCSDGSSGDGYQNATTGGSSGTGGTKKTITGSITSQGNAINFASCSTTGSSTRNAMILPGTTTQTNYSYYMGSKPMSGGTWTYKALTVTAVTGDDYSGTFPMDLDVDSYELKLYAVPTANAGNVSGPTEAELDANAVLTGYATADLRYVSEVSFLLVANSVSGSGTIDIKVSTESTFIPKEYTADAKILKLDGTEVSSSSQSLTPTTTPVADWGLTNEAYTAITTLDAGNYNFIVEIKNNDTTNPKTYTWSDSILVVANQESTGVIMIADILDKKPLAPTNFLACYNVPLPGADQATPGLNSYEVEFAWTDAANNESGFEIELLKVDDKRDATGVITGTPTYPMMPTNDTEWDTALTTYSGAVAGTPVDMTNVKIAKSSKEWDDIDLTELIVLNNDDLPLFENNRSPTATQDAKGTLGMNSSHLKFLLPLEHRYVARICAVNDVGKSSYTYLTFPATIKQKITVNSVDVYTMTASNVFATGVQTLNLYQIRYNLNQGKMGYNADTSASTDVTKKVLKTVYKSQDTGASATIGTGVDIITPDSKLQNATGSIPVADLVAGTTHAILETSDRVNPTSVLVELVSPKGAYWQKWKKNSDSGSDYVTSVSDNKPPKYTDYVNLFLFAYYDSGSKGNFTVADPAVYELKKEYLTLSTYTTTNCTGTTVIDEKTLDDASTHIWGVDATGKKVKSFSLRLNSSAKYNDGTNDIPLIYDKLSITLKRTDGSYSVDFDNNIKPSVDGITNDDENFKVDVSRLAAGNYTMIIYGYKGGNQYSYTHSFEYSDQ